MRLFFNVDEYTGGLAGFSISEKLGSKGTATLKLAMNAGDTPIQTGDRVTIMKDAGGTVFTGVVTIPKTDKRNSPFEMNTINISCTSLEGLLEQRIMNESYENKTAEYIITDIYYKYIRQEQITLGFIDETPDIVFARYNAKNLSVYTVLNELAKLSGGYWTVNLSTFNFHVIGSTHSAPECRTPITEEIAYLGNLQSSLSDRDLRTVQVIEGNFLQRGIINQDLYTGQDWEALVVNFPVQNVQRMEYRLTEETQASPISSEYVAEDTGAEDFNPDDYLFVWKKGSTSITYNYDCSYNPIRYYPNGVYVIAHYDARIPMRYEARNEEAIAELQRRTRLSGIRENVISDDTIVELSDAQRRAEELLQQYGEQKRTIRFDVDPQLMEDGAGIYDHNWEIGTLFHINLPAYNVVGDFILTERTIKQKVQSDDSLLYTVTLTDRNYIDDYAQAIKTLQYDVTKLSVRETDVIIKNYPINDNFGFGEELSSEKIFSIMVAPDDYTGGLCYPLSDVYNVIVGLE